MLYANMSEPCKCAPVQTIRKLMVKEDMMLITMAHQVQGRESPSPYTNPRERDSVEMQREEITWGQHTEDEG